MNIGDYVEVMNSDSAQNLGIFPATDQDLGEGADTEIAIRPGILEGFSCIDLNTIQRTINNGVGDFIRATAAGGGGHGSTNTKIRRIETVVDSFGTSITQANSATLGTTFTINKSGSYNISYMDVGPNLTPTGWGLSLNSTELTTNIDTITDADRLNYTLTGEDANNTAPSVISIALPLSVNDVIRAHTFGVVDGNTRCRFTITKVG